MAEIVSDRLRRAGARLRERVLEALARGDGQMLDGFDLGHTAEMMYGQQADAVTLLIGKEVQRFAKDVANDLRRDAGLKSGIPGSKHQRRALLDAADDLVRAGKAFCHRTQSAYNETRLAKPLGALAVADAILGGDIDV